ncbi:M16 family metallopeptidase [Croceibacterium ferulae]|uniref:M16 family metallopeptidase n=1 Tax=Croceibacterium ferulae TaxID=1854641 RepID=UPI001F4E45BE|nr:insulinase family protein [Croceibacterium ferulae]
MIRLSPALPLALLAATLPLLPAPAAAQVSAIAASDLPTDPGWRIGTLPTGLTYLIRANATPAGQGTVQLWIGSGSLEEHDAERGLAHFIEHMAFNGSTHVPEGEMVRLLEREGLAFGADTNASTGFEQTLYRLDLPRADPALLETALMLMRETAGELTFDPAAVARERGVVLAELRTRDTYAYRETENEFAFLYPGARFPHRMPIGSADVLRTAGADQLRGLWRRLYRPDNAALIVVGDFDPAMVEAAIRARFADWTGAAPADGPSAGPVPLTLSGLTEIYRDPALPERVSVIRHGPWVEGLDSVQRRQTRLLQSIGYAIVNRRLQRLARMPDPPFKAAGFGTGEVFGAARSTRLIVDVVEGGWQVGIATAQAEYRRALAQGFTEAELAEQLAQLRTAQEQAAAGAATRSHASHVAAAIALLDDGTVPTTPASSLARFEAFAPTITAAAVHAALAEDAVPLTDPLIRWEGRTPPEGGTDALRQAWDTGMAAPVATAQHGTADEWAYADWGTPGTVVADSTGPMGIRTLTFANGLRVNLKHTDLAANRISLRLGLDGGRLLDTADRPLGTALADSLPAGGLGRHSADALQSIFAGRNVQLGFSTGEDRFTFSANTTPADLALQLQLLAAALTDPGYRPEGEQQHRRAVADFFARAAATPQGALATQLGAILSDNDPRFSLQPRAEQEAASFADLSAAMGDRLASGALELALVGDFDESAAIAAIAATLGALPPREADFRAHADNRSRSYTADRTPRTLYHDGPPTQALLRLSWPTTDGNDLATYVRLQLLERVAQLELTDSLRERLGQTYSPSASATLSRTWPDYGEFALSAGIAPDQVAAARTAMLATVTRLATTPIDEDELLRARQPLLQAYANALKGNGGWLGLATRAQSRPEDIGRFQATPELIAAITPAELQATAARWLDAGQALEVTVLPRSQAPLSNPEPAE